MRILEKIVECTYERHRKVDTYSIYAQTGPKYSMIYINYAKTSPKYVFWKFVLSFVRKIIKIM